MKFLVLSSEIPIIQGNPNIIFPKQWSIININEHDPYRRRKVGDNSSDAQLASR